MEKRSSKNRRRSDELYDSQPRISYFPMSTYAGASLSKVNRNNTSQKIVYTVFTGNSAAVKRRGNKET